MKNIYLALLSILLFASCGQEPATEIENKIKVGSVGFHIAFKVPNDSIQRMEVFLDRIIRNLKCNMKAYRSYFDFIFHFTS